MRLGPRQSWLMVLAALAPAAIILLWPQTPSTLLFTGPVKLMTIDGDRREGRLEAKTPVCLEMTMDPPDGYYRVYVDIVISKDKVVRSPDQMITPLMVVQ